MSQVDLICDRSFGKLHQVPAEVLAMTNLKMLYLDGNLIESLPEDLFECLPKLYWCDLRNNLLTSIPAGIAHHAYLENLLLQKNCIERLPNELGLVPNLKVLQIADNPLTYPPSEIINGCVDDICIYLKQEYYKEHGLSFSANKINASSDTSIRSSSSNLPEPQIAIDTNPTSLESLNKRIESQRSSATENYCAKNKRIHKITKKASKISVHSHYNGNICVGKLLTNKEELQNDQQLKDLWLDRLKNLISDQEKIIQQEKSLDMLTKWRQNVRLMQKSSLNNLPRITEAPFDTNAEYNSLMSRFDTTMLVEQAIRSKTKVIEEVDVEELIGDVVKKLKGMEVKLKEEVSPREKLANAEREIQMIVDLHKKIACAQATNNLT